MEDASIRISPDIAVRQLTLDHDFEDVRDLYDLCADYLSLEQGDAPNDRMAMEFFTDGPPGHPIDRVLKLGIFEAGHLIGVADMTLGYPTPDDAYIGLLLFAQTHRGKGRGPRVLDYLEDRARLSGATRLYLAVLDVNPRARNFWEQRGFELQESIRRKIGRRDHLIHRMTRPIRP